MITQPSLQQQHHHPLYRSATPPPPRPRSAAAPAPPSLLPGRHVIPRSHSVSHARPPPQDPSPQPVAANPQAQTSAPEPQAGSPVHIDYTAIQRIADGVERMVRSWSKDSSCRARVYAKAYDSLHAAIARGKDQVGLPQPTQPAETSSLCTEVISHPDITSPQLLDLHNLQSPADPNSVEMAPCIFDMRQHGNTIDSSNLIVDDEAHVSPPHQHVQETGSLRDGGYTNANLSVTARPYAMTASNPFLLENEVALYTEVPPFAIVDETAKKRKTANNGHCTQNRMLSYPVGLGLIREDETREQHGSVPVLEGGTRLACKQLDDTLAEFDRQEQPRSQWQGPQQVSLLESGTPLSRRQQFHRSGQPQNMPLLIRNDLIQSNFRTRNAALQLACRDENEDAPNEVRVQAKDRI